MIDACKRELARPLLAAALPNPLDVRWLDAVYFLLYCPTMPARPVQISVDEELLQRIDDDPEARERGRSAFIRSAVECYLSAKERQETETRLERPYDAQADALVFDVDYSLVGETSD